jgi:hypothetical protein
VRKRGAGVGATGCVEPELQAFAMDVVGKRLDAAWERGGICKELAGGWIASAYPAIILRYVLITRRGHAACGDGIRHRLDDVFVRVAREGVP